MKALGRVRFGIPGIIIGVDSLLFLFSPVSIFCLNVGIWDKRGITLKEKIIEK